MPLARLELRKSAVSALLCLDIKRGRGHCSAAAGPCSEGDASQVDDCWVMGGVLSVCQSLLLSRRTCPLPSAPPGIGSESGLQPVSFVVGCVASNNRQGLRMRGRQGLHAHPARSRQSSARKMRNILLHPPSLPCSLSPLLPTCQSWECRADHERRLLVLLQAPWHLDRQKEMPQGGGSRHGSRGTLRSRPHDGLP